MQVIWHQNTNGQHFADIFKYIFLNEMCCIFIQILLNFISEGPINGKSAFVQMMAWCLTGSKPLPESMSAKVYYTMRHHWATMS